MYFVTAVFSLLSPTRSLFYLISVVAHVQEKRGQRKGFEMYMVHFVCIFCPEFKENGCDIPSVCWRGIVVCIHVHSNESYSRSLQLST